MAIFQLCFDNIFLCRNLISLELKLKDSRLLTIETRVGAEFLIATVKANLKTLKFKYLLW